MDKLRLEIDLPVSLYDKLGAFIIAKVDEAFKDRLEQTRKQKIKLTRQETARRLRISLPTLDKLRADGVLKAQPVGKRILYSEDEIEKYLNRE